MSQRKYKVEHASAAALDAEVIDATSAVLPDALLPPPQPFAAVAPAKPLEGDACVSASAGDSVVDISTLPTLAPLFR